MDLKTLLYNRDIYIDKDLITYTNELVDRYIVTDVDEFVMCITQNLSVTFLRKHDLYSFDNQTINVGDIYEVRCITFLDSLSMYSQDFMVYEKSNDKQTLQEIFNILKDSYLYKGDDIFKRSLDISIICEDTSHLKEFFGYRTIPNL